MKIILVLLILTSFVLSCSKDKNEESFSYDLSHNGCPTGRKTFNSKDAMCATLKDDGANNYCANQLREEHFKQNQCPGDYYDN